MIIDIRKKNIFKLKIVSNNTIVDVIHDEIKLVILFKLKIFSSNNTNVWFAFINFKT